MGDLREQADMPEPTRADILRKLCTRCGATKPRDAFHRNGRRPDGLQAWCRSCKTEHARDSYDPAKAARLHAERQQRDDYRAMKKAAYDRWRAEHPDRAKAAYDRWRAEHPEQHRANHERWCEENPERRAIGRRESSRRRKSRVRKQSAGPVSYAAILDRDGMVCHLCKGEIESLDDLHFDHVIPLARGGAHHEDNIRPAHALCNMRKGARLL